MKRILGIVVIGLGVALLSVTGNEPSTSARPGHGRKADNRRDVEELQERLRTPHDYVAEADARIVRERAQTLVVEERLRSETDRLLRAMTAHLEDEAPHASARLARLVDLSGLARFLVEEAERRTERLQWLPLGRVKAPAFLAAVAFEESSWRWKDASLRGSRGERCAFQVGTTAVQWSGHTEDEVVHDPVACLDAALNVMRLCVERCGENPAEKWMGCYATAGTCGGAPDVVATRFTLARKFLLFAQRSVDD
jgi:hypothetical protein